METTKKVFISSHKKDIEFFVRVILKQLGLKEVDKSEDADYVVVSISPYGQLKKEEHLKELNNKPAIIITTHKESYHKNIFDVLKERGIENKKLIIRIPANYPDVVEKFKKILLEEEKEEEEEEE